MLKDIISQAARDVGAKAQQNKALREQAEAETEKYYHKLDEKLDERFDKFAAGIQELVASLLPAAVKYYDGEKENPKLEIFMSDFCGAEVLLGGTRLFNYYNRRIKDKGYNKMPARKAAPYARTIVRLSRLLTAFHLFPGEGLDRINILRDKLPPKIRFDYSYNEEEGTFYYAIFVQLG